MVVCGSAPEQASSGAGRGETKPLLTAMNHMPMELYEAEHSPV